MRLILIAALSWPLTAAVTISTPASSSREIVVAGVADGKTATYKNSLWISADAEVPSLAVVPTELRGPGGPIPVSSVHLNLPITLQKNVPKELTVSIETALVQGDFQGALALSEPANSSSIDPIALTVHLSPRPNVVPVPAAFAFKATRRENMRSTPTTTRASTMPNFAAPTRLPCRSRWMFAMDLWCRC